jgi:hypothetical protein
MQPTPPRGPVTRELDTCTGQDCMSWRTRHVGGAGEGRPSSPVRPEESPVQDRTGQDWTGLDWTVQD